MHPDATKTGAYVRKYLADGSSPLLIQQYYSEQNCIIFRLGEIYLNAAEAAVEMGRDGNARDYIEPIRTRAGLTQNLRLETYSGTDLRDRIRNERKIVITHRFCYIRFYDRVIVFFGFNDLVLFWYILPRSISSASVQNIVHLCIWR